MPPAITRTIHLLVFAFILLGSGGTASAGWIRLPGSEAGLPVNVAAGSIPGTKIAGGSGIENAPALLADDATTTATIPVGKTSAVLGLATQQVVEKVTFANYDAGGTVTCSGSPDNRDWTPLGTVVFSSGDRLVRMHFASMSLKYLKVSFEAARAGSIGSFRLFGAATDKDFTLTAAEGDREFAVNLASGTGGTRPIYAFPSPLNIGDYGFRDSFFEFPKTGEKYRTIVYELGSEQTLKQFGSSYSRRPTRIEVFTFEERPEKKDWRGKLTFDPAVFNTMKPAAAGEDPRGIGHMTLVPSTPVRARYVAIRYEPNYLGNTTGAIFDGGWSRPAIAFLGPLATAVEALAPRARPHRTAAASPADFVVSAVAIQVAGAFELKRR